MPLPPGNFTVLTGIKSINDAVFEEQVVENLTSFFNWGLLGIGAFFNVKRPSSKSLFKPVTTPNFVHGRVWESSRGNWVWESGVSYNIQPIRPSGVYINNVFTPMGSGYYINYNHGQIVFDNPVSTTSKVEMEYAYRRFNFYDSNTDWFKQVVFDPLPESGVRDVLAKNRVYLPAVIIEVIPDTTMTGYQLGDNTVVEDQAVLFHIIADHDEDRDKMIRTLKSMYNKTIWLYDTNKVADANAFATNADGSLSQNALTYPNMLEQFAWKRCTFANVRPQDITTKLPLHRAVVRATLRVLMP